MKNELDRTAFQRGAKYLAIAGLAGLSVFAISRSIGNEASESVAATVDPQPMHSCAVTLDDDVLSSFKIADNSSVNAAGCKIQSASNIGQGAVSPVKLNGEISDPLDEVDQPVVGACDHQDVTLKAGDHVLRPGVYCGGIVSLARSNIKMAPGIYIIKDGPLYLGGAASLSGQNVGIFFHGSESVFGFGASTSLNLTAPEDGPMAGIILSEDRLSPLKREFVIRSFDARMLVGSIYLPKGRLVIDNGSNVGQRSEWTSIIAHQIDVRGNSKVQLNSNYSKSRIPLPQFKATSRMMAQAAPQPL